MKMVYIRAEIIGENAVGQKRVHLLANNADGIVIWTNDKGFLDPERGEIREVGKSRWMNGRCDNCGAHAPHWPLSSTYYKSRFCPNCGYMMDEGGDRS